MPKFPKVISNNYNLRRHGVSELKKKKNNTYRGSGNGIVSGGTLRLNKCKKCEFNGIDFREEIKLYKCKDVEFNNCVFNGISLIGSKRIRFQNCRFIGGGLNTYGSAFIHAINCIFEQISNSAVSIWPNGKYNPIVNIRGCIIRRCDMGFKINGDISTNNITAIVENNSFVSCMNLVDVTRIRGKCSIIYRGNLVNGIPTTFTNIIE